MVEPERAPHRTVSHAVSTHCAIPFRPVSLYRQGGADTLACALVCVPRIATTIIAPTPLIAANFVILGQIIKRLGQQYSRLSAMWCASPFPTPSRNV